MKKIEGKVLFLDRSDINTDEIIPARYLTEISKQALKPYLLEDLKMDGFDPKADIGGKSVVISRRNFGCGSSREHAPWAFEVNGIRAIIAVNFARIFRQNMFNRGMLAVELDEKVIDEIFTDFACAPSGCDCTITAETENGGTITLRSAGGIGSGGLTKTYPFVLNGFQRALVESGGWLGYVEQNY